MYDFAIGLLSGSNDWIDLDLSEERPSLLDSDALSALRFPKGFATLFLSRARTPRFTYFAPGLRVATEQETLDQPFTHHEENGDAEDELIEVPPLLLLRADVSVSAAELFWLRAFEPVIPRSAQCPCGLYVTPCDRAYRYPQEDGCSFVLPGTAPSGWAKKTHVGPVESHDDLLKTDVNPFNDLHPIFFSAFSENVRFQIGQGRWAVGSEDVAGGLNDWCNTDTEERRKDYVTDVRPQVYW